MAKSSKKYCADSDLGWTPLKGKHFVGIQVLPDGRLEKFMKRSVAIRDDGKGVLISDRIWSKPDNPDDYYGRGPERTRINMNWHLRNSNDVLDMVKLLAENIRFIQQNSNMLDTCNIDVDFSDNGVTINMQKEEEVLDFSDFDDEHNAEAQQFEEEQLIIDDDDFID